ncbi:hypothetical protein FFK22_041060 [Mycobacterium sp. KBS0706]|uniref:hypothetical protein n=1 Tax=Mycobacterium sp. KBS0706 TaxID=2578109 RepID=UPI00110F921D|nr:hypothetical protein [Mycobacterium sp. KBS0706]TSD82826.1 hypothetical protein FFK22_041060 [Mycobacterium sp. KBS0706]
MPLTYERGSAILGIHGLRGGTIMKIQLLAAAIVLLGTGSVAAEPLSIATWNVEAATAESVLKRADPIGRAAAAYRAATPDNALPQVIVLDEITSVVAAAEVARFLGYANATVIATDHSNDSDVWPNALEVGIVTTKTVVSVTSIEQQRNREHPERDPLRPPFIYDLATSKVNNGTVEELRIPSQLPDAFVPRGILRVELEGGVVVYGVHLNSSGLGFCRPSEGVQGLIKAANALGLVAKAIAVENAEKAVRQAMPKARNPGIAATTDEALDRARSREASLGVVAERASADVAAGKSVFVAGDFNTPFVEKCKTGKKLGEDFRPLVGCSTGLTPETCGTTDGFDDSYAILTEALIGTVKFKSLTSGLGRTYVSTNFADSPIDNVFVAGPLASRTFTAVKLSEPLDDNTVFASDHHPVLVTSQ